MSIGRSPLASANSLRGCSGRRDPPTPCRVTDTVSTRSKSPSGRAYEPPRRVSVPGATVFESPIEDDPFGNERPVYCTRVSGFLL